MMIEKTFDEFFTFTPTIDFLLDVREYVESVFGGIKFDYLAFDNNYLATLTHCILDDDENGTMKQIVGNNVENLTFLLNEFHLHVGGVLSTYCTIKEFFIEPVKLITPFDDNFLNNMLTRVPQTEMLIEHHLHGLTVGCVEDNTTDSISASTFYEFDEYYKRCGGNNCTNIISYWTY